jgi:uncharacterized Ntn-hydrolase superfamily protein
MTWSIVARDEEGRFGVAIASRFFAVGALCIHTARGVGAVATQALMNPLFGGTGLEALRAGLPADEVVASLLEADDGRELRQVHVIAAQGRPSAYSGARCQGWSGDRVFDDFSVAGNMLANGDVVDATAEAFRGSAGRPLADRLVDAMRAGEAAGGDKRGRQAAALRIHGREDYPELDLRVDDHPDPLAELARLNEKSHERFIPFVACLPGHADRTGLVDRDAIEARIAAHVAARADPKRTA